MIQQNQPLGCVLPSSKFDWEGNIDGIGRTRESEVSSKQWSGQKIWDFGSSSLLELGQIKWNRQGT